MKTITLCGTTAANLLFEQINALFTLQGNCVFSVGFIGAVLSSDAAKEAMATQADVMERVHFSKIDRSDEIFVINPFGYIGEFTKKEIEYAEHKSKPIRYLDDEFAEEDYLQRDFYSFCELSYNDSRWLLFKSRLGFIAERVHLTRFPSKGTVLKHLNFYIELYNDRWQDLLKGNNALTNFFLGKLMEHFRGCCDPGYIKERIVERVMDATTF